MKLSSKIFFLLIDFPFNLLRNLTIPNCELHSWNRSLFILMPLSSTVFIVVGLKSMYLLDKSRMVNIFR